MTDDHQASNLSDKLWKVVEREVRETSVYTGRSVLKDDVKRALKRIDRSLFVPDPLKSMAWENHPLSIGCDQTISQPFIVALMTDLLDIEKGDRVLEVGTGSGYQTAVLAELAGEVYTVERITALAKSAAEKFKQLGCNNVMFRIADGYEGWQEYAPYDAIILTAAPDETPISLIQQLAEGGRMVFPVGEWMSGQSLIRGVKYNGELLERQVLPVSFVPMLTGLE